MKILITILVSAITALGVMFVYNNVDKAFGGEGGVAATDCTASTSVMAVGNGTAVKILDNHAQRAWAKVDFLHLSGIAATNTASFFFDSFTHNTNTVGTSGYRVSSTTDPAIFGLNTDLPFTGEVYVITDVASTSIHVAECRY